jgi:hypothetical protein
MQKFIIKIDHHMKKLFILVFTLTFVAQGCRGQQQFEEFVKKFSPVNLPIDSIQFVKPVDTVNMKLFNHIIWESQPKEERDGKKRTIRPKVFKNGKLLDLNDFGKAYDTPLNYRTVDGKEGKFYSKVYPVARITLHKSYVSLIVKEYDSELSHYDLYNFTKDGIRLSAVPLFTYAHDKMLVDSIDYVYTESSILKDGSIVWLENNRGLKTSRVYKLRDDGYFEIIKEERTGKFEY